MDSMSYVFLTDLERIEALICTSSAFLAAIPDVETSLYCIHVKKG